MSFDIATYQNAILLMCMSSLTNVVSSLFTFVKTLLRDMLIVSISVNADDIDYTRVNEYLLELDQHSQFTYIGNRRYDGELAHRKDRIRRDGMILYWFRWRLLHIRYGLTNDDLEIQISTVGYSNDVLHDFIKTAIEAKKTVTNKNYVRVAIGNNGKWTYVFRKKRLMSNVILDDNICSDIVDDCQTYMKSRDWYESRGIPFHRGYMLRSKPGCGKTSLIFALASELNKNICIISLSSDMSDSTLMNMISQSNADIVVFEDIDCAFPPRDPEPDTAMTKTNATSTESLDASGLSKTAKKPGKLTFSGFLNCFDGIQSSEGNIVIFTTNHLNKIDEALLRPGRVDRIFEIPLASRNQIYRMVSRFFPDQPDVCREYSEQCPERQLSMATVQGHLLCHRHDAAAALSSLPQFLLDQKKPKTDPPPAELVQSTIVPITTISSEDPVTIVNKSV